MKRVDFILEKRLRAYFKNDTSYHRRFLNEKLFFNLPQGIEQPICNGPETQIEVTADLKDHKYRELDKLKDKFTEAVSDSCPTYGNYFYARQGWSIDQHGYTGTGVVMWMRGFWLTNVQYNFFNSPDDYVELHCTPLPFSDFMQQRARKFLRPLGEA